MTYKQLSVFLSSLFALTSCFDERPEIRQDIEEEDLGPIAGDLPESLRVVVAPTKCVLPTDCPDSGEKMNAYRRQMVELEPDILVGTEFFWGDDSTARSVADALADATGEAYAYHRSSGGVAVISRLPILDIKELEYDACNQPDCLVDKGTVLLQLRLGFLADGTPIDIQVAGAHRQSKVVTNNWGEVQELQVAQEAAFFAQHLRGQTLKLFAGDLNNASEAPQWFFDDHQPLLGGSVGALRVALTRAFLEFEMRTLNRWRFVSGAKVCREGRAASACLKAFRARPSIYSYSDYEAPDQEASVLKQYHVGLGRYAANGKDGYYEVYMVPRVFSGRDFTTSSLNTERSIAFDHAPLIVDYQIAVNPELMRGHYELNSAYAPADQSEMSLMQAPSTYRVVYNEGEGELEGHAFLLDDALEMVDDPYYGDHLGRIEPLAKRAYDQCIAMNQLPNRFGVKVWSSDLEDWAVRINGRALHAYGTPRNGERGLNIASCVSGQTENLRIAVPANPLVEAREDWAATTLANLYYFVDFTFNQELENTHPIEVMHLYPEPNRYRQFDDNGAEFIEPNFSSVLPIGVPTVSNPDPCASVATESCGRAGLVAANHVDLWQGEKGTCFYTCREEYWALSPRQTTLVQLPEAEPLLFRDMQP